jgi:hypothetical protein
VPARVWFVILCVALVVAVVVALTDGDQRLAAGDYEKQPALTEQELADRDRRCESISELAQRFIATQITVEGAQITEASSTRYGL